MADQDSIGLLYGSFTLQLGLIPVRSISSRVASALKHRRLLDVHVAIVDMPKLFHEVGSK